ncbi:MAG: OmpA family protein, partial [Flammeovirgaceae bacterium]|nr:OmpA family protein [Flammeovirgaceae bacterium]
INHVDIAEPTFSNVLAARNDAMETKAPIAVSEKWKEAEKCFKNAAEELEDGDLESAKEEGKRAVSLYREAEIEAIKTTFLSNTSTLIEKADDIKADKYAPVTFEKAKQLYQNAEKEIEENKEDTDYARQLARQSEFEAKHAIYLARTIKEFDDKDYTMENVLLMSEGPLMKISYVLGTDANLDSGYDVMVSDILTKIAKNQEKIGNLNYNLYANQQEIFDLEQFITEQKMFYELKLKQKEAIEEEKIQNLKNEMAVFKEKQDLLKNRMERRKMIDASYKKVENIFDNKEAKVFRQGDNIIMRLTGVNFEVGKAYIPEDSYALLNKAIGAVGEFKNVEVVIKGHTDSKGGDVLNQKLSEKRAMAVKEYMINNSGLSKEKISSKGYGETKPLASNETEKGRAQNRRIDIIIQPVFEGMQ